MSTSRPDTAGEPSPSPHERIYDSLPIDDRFVIRLLTLPPGEQADPISVTLTSVELDNAPPFAALSYVWGKVDSRAHLTPITCNGHPFEVTPNLAAALRRIRSREDSLLAWADAICINQRDLAERSFHVSFMGRIYSSADRVLVHLGPAPDGRAGDVVALVAEVNGILASYSGDVNKAPILEPSDPFLSDPRWASLERMLSVPWFTRAWVIQEVGLARDPVVLYGDSDDGGGGEFLYRDLMRLAAWHERCAPTLTSRWGIEFSTVHSGWLDWTVSRADAWNGHLDQTFLDLVNQASWLGCADHRDHIYSLLGHPFASVDKIKEGENDTSQKTLVVTPDYHKSVEDVYLELATELIRQPRGLRVLSAAEHADDAEIDNEGSAPSWVPMWRRFITICTLGICVGFYYNASGTLGERRPHVVAPAPSATALEEMRTLAPPTERVLRVAGVFVDVVREAFAFDDKHFELPWTADSPARLGDTMQSIWDATVGSSPSHTERSPYMAADGSGDGRLDALSLTLAAGMTGDDPAESPEHFPAHRANFRAYLAVSGLGKRAKSEPAGASGPGIVGSDATSDPGNGDAEKFWLDMRFMSYGRSFFVTTKGYFGLGPRIVREGDRCVVLLGAKVPFVVRRATGAGSAAEERWKLVGECYLHGIMNGEAAESCGGGATEMEIC